MMIKEVVRTIRLNLYQVIEGFLVYDESFQKVQPKLNKCKVCHAEFKYGDIINLGFVRGHVNIVLCDNCVKKTHDTDVSIRKGKYVKKEEI